MATYLPIADAARESFMRTSILVQMPVFALGMVAFFVFERFIRGRALSRVWGFLLAVGAMLTYDSLIAGRLPPVFASIYGQGIIYSMLLIGLAVTPFGLLVNPVSRFYGKISYSVYLNHPTFVFVLTPVYRFVYSVDARPTIQYGTCLLLTLLILTAVAYGTYRLVERPGMRLGSFLMRRLGNGAPLPR
jgi:peptidoglycan/LPS O-acetylase OafA/YrhL